MVSALALAISVFVFCNAAWFTLGLEMEEHDRTLNAFRNDAQSCHGPIFPERWSLQAVSAEMFGRGRVLGQWLREPRCRVSAFLFHTLVLWTFLWKAPGTSDADVAKRRGLTPGILTYGNRKLSVWFLDTQLLLRTSHLKSARMRFLGDSEDCAVPMETDTSKCFWWQSGNPSGNQRTRARMHATKVAVVLDSM